MMYECDHCGNPADDLVADEEAMCRDCKTDRDEDYVVPVGSGGRVGSYLYCLGCGVYVKAGRFTAHLNWCD